LVIKNNTLIFTVSKQPTMITEKVHISRISSGDTVIHNEQIKTVTNSNIKYCSFMGTTLWGDSYHSGYKLVERVTKL